MVEFDHLCGKLHSFSVPLIWTMYIAVISLLCVPSSRLCQTKWKRTAAAAAAAAEDLWVLKLQSVRQALLFGASVSICLEFCKNGRSSHCSFFSDWRSLLSMLNLCHHGSPNRL